MNEQTIRTYNQMAEEYDEETSGFWNTFPRTFLDAFAETARGTILDVGCGPGRDALLLQEKGLSVICLDASEAMLMLCKAKGFETIQADYSKIPLEEASIDGVWAYTSLLHISKGELPKALSEIARVLKTDGVFGLGMIEGDTEGYLESSGMTLPRWFSLYAKEELEGILSENGFEIIHFETFKPKSKNYLQFILKKR